MDVQYRCLRGLYCTYQCMLAFTTDRLESTVTWATSSLNSFNTAVTHGISMLEILRKFVQKCVVLYSQKLHLKFSAMFTNSEMIGFNAYNLTVSYYMLGLCYLCNVHVQSRSYIFYPGRTEVPNCFQQPFQPSLSELH